MAPLHAAKPEIATDGIDPLLLAINTFIFSGDAYDALPEDLEEVEEQVQFERLIAQPDDILVNWRAPATSYEGAVAALKLAISEVDQWSEEPIVASLLRAALAYFEGRNTQ